MARFLDFSAPAPVLPVLLVLFAAQLPLECEAVPPRILAFEVDDPQLPLDGRPWLSWETVGADRVSLSPGIGDVTGFTDADGFGNGVLPSPASLFRFVDTNEDWIFLDDGSDLSNENWTALDYRDLSWQQNSAPFGYGDTVSTEISFGADETDKAITYYFRKPFEVSAEALASIDVLFLEVLRDDGAIVYLNGTEILRDNLPEGDITAATRASVATAGDAETQHFRYVIDKSLLVTGSNILAAEVHQVSPTSSDVIFDAGLYMRRSTSTAEVINFNSTWRFLDNGSDLAGSDWMDTGFDDGSWKEGPGEFGFNSSGESTVINFGDDANNKFTTYYFRRKFLVGDAADVDELFANVLYDDGVILYVNGVEAARANLPAGVVGADTLATTTSAEGVFEELDFSNAIPFLFNGENTVAVEIHQASPGSSDISFDLDLIGTDSGGNALSFVERRALWRYDDTGADRGTSNQDPDIAWFGPQFDDSNWAAGFAELGYGEGGDTFPTNVSFGPDPDNKFLTTYFRKTFELDAATIESAEDFSLSLQRDDGAIIYLNGTEIVRDNIEEGDIDATIPALGASATTTNWPVDKGLFVAGTNTIAVEVHQQSAQSSDLFFDLRLTGNVSISSITYTLTVENEDGVATADVTVDYVPVVDGSPLPAEPVFLTSSHPSGVDWTFAAMWSNRMVPNPAHEYIVYGNFASTVRSPIGAIDPDFGGPLTLRGPRSRLLLAHANGTTALIPQLTIQEGSVWHSAADSFLQLGAPDSRVIIETAASFSYASATGGRVLAIGSALSGPGTITVSGPDTRDGSTATFFLGDGTDFSGDWIIEDTVGAVGPNALGTGNITITETGALDFDYDYHNADATITMLGRTSQLVVDHTISVGAMIVQGLSIPDGVYADVALDALGQNFVPRGGKLIIAGENPDSDSDSLLDEWELENFGSLAQTGSDDNDGDGANNASEEIAATDPNDPASVFRLFVSQGVAEDGVSPAIIFTWAASLSRSYLVQASFDLQNWRTLGIVPGTDGPLTFVDDANFPPAEGDPPLFYRVVLSGS